MYIYVPAPSPRGPLLPNGMGEVGLTITETDAIGNTMYDMQREHSLLWLIMIALTSHGDLVQ